MESNSTDEIAVLKMKSTFNRIFRMYYKQSEKYRMKNE